MIKDINQRPMEYVGIAFVKPSDPADEFWDVYLFNLQDVVARNVIVVVRGYGILGESEKETATMRYFYEGIRPLDYVKIEPIHRDLFELENEYWVSFQAKDYLYDKRFVLPKAATENSELENIPFINRLGILIQ